ncbi:hypothetical protein N476_19645 [Pseudoalteromonas luteoviolacea H33]|uniref:Uncharacterized protein n=1 Tax=Pseudoalteromonas luteoviolacea H33 TaxID=1365251 RepID=A0A167DRS1_9GAMM|nr:hypothetical protein N476_19645 [Pseudoalteromonas luteoviolacea H33]KZN74933.1 hypothetical protein N477_21145 [Pseudoalteromonas luteoviolacea H33-S]
MRGNREHISTLGMLLNQIPNNSDGELISVLDGVQSVKKEDLIGSFSFID